MALGLLMILFIGMSVISGLGILFLYLIKDAQRKKRVLYLLAVWGMIIAVMSATSLPSNFLASQFIAWSIGLLSVVGLLVHVKAKTKSQYNVAYLLVTISVVAGMIKLFMF